jgi:ribonuclease HII
MTAAQLESDTERLRREVVQLKQDFRLERERLERLAAAYQDSKKLNPAQRYTALKDMIKDATVTASSSTTTVTSEASQRPKAASSQRVTAVKS